MQIKLQFTINKNLSLESIYLYLSLEPFVQLQRDRETGNIQNTQNTLNFII